MKIYGALALLPAVTAAVPLTYQTFTAAIQQTSTLDMSAMMKAVTNLTGKVYYDAPGQKMRMDVKTGKFEIVISGMPGGGGAGGGGVIPGGGGGIIPGGGGGAGADTKIVIDLPGDMVQLLRYDMGKNFTWFSTGGGTECTCSDIEDEFMAYYVTPSAEGGAESSITIDGKTVSTTQYAETISLGDAGSVSYVFNVEGNTSLVRMGVNTTFKAGDIEMKTQDLTEMWDVVASVEDEMWKPHSSCKCPKPPVIPTVPETDYPAVATPTVPAPACVAEGGCKCFGETELVDLAFCKDVATYPVRAQLFAKSTDEFVKTVYDSSPVEKEGECGEDYKKWLCRFYFQKCSEGGVPKVPAAFVAGSGCSSAGIEKTAAGELYDEVAELDKESGGGGASGSVMTGVSLASVLLAPLLSVFAVSGAQW